MIIISSHMCLPNATTQWNMKSLARVQLVSQNIAPKWSAVFSRTNKATNCQTNPHCRHGNTPWFSYQCILFAACFLHREIGEHTRVCHTHAIMQLTTYTQESYQNTSSNRLNSIWETGNFTVLCRIPVSKQVCMTCSHHIVLAGLKRPGSQPRSLLQLALAAPFNLGLFAEGWCSLSNSFQARGAKIGVGKITNIAQMIIHSWVTGPFLMHAKERRYFELEWK